MCPSCTAEWVAHSDRRLVGRWGSVRDQGWHPGSRVRGSPKKAAHSQTGGMRTAHRSRVRNRDARPRAGRCERAGCARAVAPDRRRWRAGASGRRRWVSHRQSEPCRRLARLRPPANPLNAEMHQQAHPSSLSTIRPVRSKQSMTATLCRSYFIEIEQAGGPQLRADDHADLVPLKQKGSYVLAYSVLIIV